MPPCALRRWAVIASMTAAACWVGLQSCAPPAVTPGRPAPIPTPSIPTAEAPTPAAKAPTPVAQAPIAPPEPVIRIGLAVGAEATILQGDAGLIVTDPPGSTLARVAAGAGVRLTPSGAGVTLAGTGSGAAERVSVTAADGEGLIRVNGRPYRGSVDILRDRSGITVVNRLPLEAYLHGVVSSEMGRRSPAEREALRAQAVVSRTYAVRNQRRWNAEGFDLYASVADQVYGGAAAETPEGVDAVRTTRGQLLTFNGSPIDAFFYSTCGGRTVTGTEVFRAADRAYLRSVSDLAADGTAYCSISPRFRWREEWSGELLRTTLRRTLPVETRLPASAVQGVRDVRVVALTGSGRVAAVSVALESATARVEGPAVRRVLRSPSGDLLRSSLFTLTATRSGGHVVQLVAEGSGAGHGVGFCQWGAVGRARAGQDYQRILAEYYPGTTLERLY